MCSQIGVNGRQAVTALRFVPAGHNEKLKIQPKTIVSDSVYPAVFLWLEKLF
jgi:hypothetical protein